jgi:hypothetical protein
MSVRQFSVYVSKKMIFFSENEIRDSNLAKIYIYIIDKQVYLQIYISKKKFKNFYFYSEWHRLFRRNQFRRR